MSGDDPLYTYPPSLLNNYTAASELFFVTCILYGIYIVIAGKSLILLDKKQYKHLVYYSIVQLVLTTLYFAISLYIAPALSLTIFNIVGPYSHHALSLWPGVIINSTFVLNTWASDGFLVRVSNSLYRCYVICMDNKVCMAYEVSTANKYTLVCPILLYLGTLSSSVAWLVVSSTGGVYSTHTVRVANLCYWSCSAAMTFCATFLICTRFWMFRQTIRHANESKRGTFYLVFMVVTLESALLYTVFAVVALVVFALKSPLKNVFCLVLGMVQSIAPALIIHRIARGIPPGTDALGGTGVIDSLQFPASCQLRSIERPDHRDFSDDPGMHTVLGEVMTDRDGHDSYIQNCDQQTGTESQSIV